MMSSEWHSYEQYLCGHNTNTNYNLTKSFWCLLECIVGKKSFWDSILGR